jgi:2-amino-4-hydroxy-6-hydroxymethyldihydropteridine diphosphokinase
VKAYVSIGSNLGDRATNLLYAVRGLLEASLTVCRLSAIYETEPVGVESHDDYLNMVAEINISHVTPEQMLARMLRIEYLLGRRREFPKAPRTVDLDLLLFGEMRYQSDFVTIPHPQLHLRRFILVPLKELAPHLVHPVLNQTIEEILENVPDHSKVRRWYAVTKEPEKIVVEKI